MTTEQQQATVDEQTGLVLKDSAGHYYAVPMSALAAYRVPDARTAAAEAALAAASEEDTQGHFIGMAIIFIGGTGVLVYKGVSALLDD